MVEAYAIVIAFLIGCCVGVAPWHRLARKTKQLLHEIDEKQQRFDQAIRDLANKGKV